MNRLRRRTSVGDAEARVAGRSGYSSHSRSVLAGDVELAPGERVHGATAFAWLSLGARVDVALTINGQTSSVTPAWHDAD